MLLPYSNSYKIVFKEWANYNYITPHIHVFGIDESVGGSGASVRLIDRAPLKGLSATFISSP